jgi:hypothetical protein
MVQDQTPVFLKKPTRASELQSAAKENITGGETAVWEFRITQSLDISD